MLHTRLALAAAVILAGGVVAGCEEDDDKYSTKRDRDGDGIADRYDREPTRDARRDDRLDDDDDAVISRDRVGSDRLRGLDEIPRDAVRVDTGTGTKLSYDPKRDGRVFLYDEDDDRVVYSGRVYRDEDFSADPDDDELLVNGKKIDEVNLRAKHRYRLYFLPNDSR